MIGFIEISYADILQNFWGKGVALGICGIGHSAWVLSELHGF